MLVQIMLSAMVKEGTKYACNDDHSQDLICLQSQFQKACNLGNKKDYICLQS